MVAYIISSFPRPLTRTELMKLVFLFECNFYRSYGQTFTGVTWFRHYYGPFSREVLEAARRLENKGVIRIVELPNYYSGSTFYHFPLEDEVPSLDPSVRMVIDWTLAQTVYLDLDGIKRLAYAMPPMERLHEEGVGNQLGRVLDMSAMRKDRSKKSLLAIKHASKRINRECRGDKDRYAFVLLSEYEALAKARKRANEWLP